MCVIVERYLHGVMVTRGVCVIVERYLHGVMVTWEMSYYVVMVTWFIKPMLTKLYERFMVLLRLTICLSDVVGIEMGNGCIDSVLFVINYLIKGNVK
jgi:hypothetical protein